MKKTLNIDATISVFISKKLYATFNNDIRKGFCASSDKKISEQRRLDETLGIRACKAGFELGFSLYISGDVIPTLEKVLKRHQLLIDNTVNERIPFGSLALNHL